jgi:hypothetical protein
LRWIPVSFEDCLLRSATVTERVVGVFVRFRRAGREVLPWWRGFALSCFPDGIAAEHLWWHFRASPPGTVRNCAFNFSPLPNRLYQFIGAVPAAHCFSAPHVLLRWLMAWPCGVLVVLGLLNRAGFSPARAGVHDLVRGADSRSGGGREWLSAQKWPGSTTWAKLSYGLTCALPGGGPGADKTWLSARVGWLAGS